MRRSFVLLVLIVLAVSAAAIAAQDSSKSLPVAIRVRSLELVSPDLTPRDCLRIEARFRGKRYVPDGLQERVRQALRDEGFYKAKVGPAQIAHRTGSAGSMAANFRFDVVPGARYRLAGIRFVGGSSFSKDPLVFPPDQLRAQFHLADGELLRATAITGGLGNLNRLYATSGYIDFAGILRADVDETRHTVALTIEADRGKRYYFSRLFLDGVEPHAGDAAALFDAWGNLRGRPYNPDAVGRWLASYAPYWPDEREAMRHISTMQHPGSQLIDVRLNLP
jgi:hypothetical protein